MIYDFLWVVDLLRCFGFQNDSRGSNSRESFAKKLIKRLAKQRAMPTAVTLEFDPTGPLG